MNGKGSPFRRLTFEGMLQIPGGQFFGRTTVTTRLEGLTLTDTEYLHDKVDWHYHEKPYFTFLLQGGLIEGTRRSTHECSAGSLLFHNWDEPHYNIKPRGISRGFHIEMERSWLDDHDIELAGLNGDKRVFDPDVKFLFHRIHLESNEPAPEREPAIHALLLQAFVRMKGEAEAVRENRPAWVGRVREMLHGDCPDMPSLKELALFAGVHPVHLSRSFSRYFHCTLGEYVRKLRVDYAMTLLADPSHTLTDVAHKAGFSDQSHFTRSLKGILGVRPSLYRKKGMRRRG